MTSSIEKKLQEVQKQSNHSQHKLSALILYKGRPLSFGVNDQYKTDPKIKKYTDVKKTHAEMSAIFRIKSKSILKACTMVVYREDKMGNIALAKPCAVCECMIKDYGIKKVIYSTPNGWKTEKY